MNELLAYCVSMLDSNYFLDGLADASYFPSGQYRFSSSRPLIKHLQKILSHLVNKSIFAMQISEIIISFNAKLKQYNDNNSFFAICSMHMKIYQKLVYQ